MKGRLLSKLADLDIASRIYPTQRTFIHAEEEDPTAADYIHKVVFESAKPKKNICCLPDINFSFLNYFLDGSRRTYILAYMIYGDKYLPIVAGQVGAACTTRNNKRVSKLLLKKDSYLLLPEILENYHFDSVRSLLSSHPFPIALDTYKYKEITDKPLVEFAIAKLTSLMHDQELEMIKYLCANHLLSHNSLLVVDGSLQFEKVQGVNFDNVIGVSKTFKINVSGLAKPKQREVGALLQDLTVGWRTPVFQVRDKNIGYWYLRIRERKGLETPLEGIVKVEMFSQGNQESLDSSLVNNVSKFLVLERTPVCYGIDKRWANLLYPIYITEQLLKRAFLSEIYFTNLF